jgi:hypothetical protein
MSAITRRSPLHALLERCQGTDRFQWVNGNSHVGIWTSSLIVRRLGAREMRRTARLMVSGNYEEKDGSIVERINVIRTRTLMRIVIGRRTMVESGRLSGKKGKMLRRGIDRLRRWNSMVERRHRASIRRNSWNRRRRSRCCQTCIANYLESTCRDLVRGGLHRARWGCRLQLAELVDETQTTSGFLAVHLKGFGDVVHILLL